MLTPQDLKQLSLKGITIEKLQSQLDRFKCGFPYLRIKSSAVVGNGIIRLSTDQENAAIDRWRRYLADGGDVIKMVPASGAASRMFKSLFAFLDGESSEPQPGSPVDELIRNIDRTPFKAELDATLQRVYGRSLARSLDEKRYKDIVAALIGSDGMNYGNLPKGLLSFHTYPDSTRTPVEEQLAEGAQTARKADGTVRMHFTVSPAHHRLFTDKLATVIPAMQQSLGVKFDVTLSEQKPSTDTIAANIDNTPFRDDNGNLLFRPGGHGALIENLNDLDASVVFLKNIDNVTPESRRADTIRYKEIIAGYLIEVHDKIVSYLEQLNRGAYTIDNLREMIHFLHDTLNLRNPELKSMEDAELALYIKRKLNRPLRVCGMVKNEGEPGGGPYITYNPDGTTSPQILESNQIDNHNPQYIEMMKQATHFNPVDLVCYIKDPDGNKYDLRAHVDDKAGFISAKSLHGKDLKAMELPGLWNGAMSDWNTIFLEVPVSTFNPVKTVNDLLRPAHQS